MKRPLPDLTHYDVDVRGIRVHVLEAGEGSPLVLQHGFPQDLVAARIQTFLGDAHETTTPLLAAMP